MLPSQIEYWALQIIDRVLRQLPDEDSRVELKKEWIPPEKAARRLAGHANAARGEKIIWLIGVDEKTGPVSLPKNDLATWLPQVFGHFVDMRPTVQDVVVHLGSHAVVALLFDTSRAPFIVKNPAHGSANGGPVASEVPWREGAATRTATRSDLMRILAPAAINPSVEMITCKVFCSKEEGKKANSVQNWIVEGEIYVSPNTDSKVTLPFHKVKVQIANSSNTFEPKADLRLIPPHRYVGHGSKKKIEFTSASVLKSDSEVILNGPGKVIFSGLYKSKGNEFADSDELDLRLELSVAGNDVPMICHTKISRPSSLNEIKKHGYWALWGSNFADGWWVI